MRDVQTKAHDQLKKPELHVWRGEDTKQPHSLTGRVRCHAEGTSTSPGSAVPKY